MTFANQIEFWTHLLILIGINAYCFAKIKTLTLDEKIFGSVLSFWTNLVLTSLSLAAFNLFNNNHFFFGLSIVFQTILCCFFWFSFRHSSPIKSTPVMIWLSEVFDTWPKKLVILACFVLAFMIFYMATHLPLGIPDTVSIKLPNAFFYLQKANFLPATEFSDDGRMFSTPINGTILWSYLIRWKQSITLILVFNFLFWLLSLPAIYRISRKIGASPWGSISAAIFFSFSVCMLFQGSSDNDDLLSSIPAILGAVFLFRWFANFLWIDMLFASLGFGLSIGCKMFPALYAPAAFLCFCYFVVKNWKDDRSKVYRAITHLVFASLICFAFITPVLIANHSRFGHVSISSPLLKGIENSPFRPQVAWHNIVVYNLQAFISPIADSTVPSPGLRRDWVVPRVNQLLVKYVKPNVENAFAYVADVNIVHPHIYYNTVWFGLFADLFVLIFLIFCFKKYPRWKVILWFGLFFISWDLFFCIRTKYIEELGRYWILPFGLAAPVLSLGWDLVKNTKSIYAQNVLKLCFIVVWITTFYAGYICLTRDKIRSNFRQTWRHEVVRQDILTPDLRAVLKSCDNINVLFRVYGYPIYTLLNEFRGNKITYNSASQSDQLQMVPALKSFLRETFYEHKYLAIPLADPTESGYKYLDQPYGIPVYGESSADCSCHSLCEGDRSIALVEFTALFSEEKELLPVRIALVNRHLQQKYLYRVSFVEKDNQKTQLISWSSNTSWQVLIPKQAEFLEVEVQPKGNLKDQKDSILVGRYPVNKAI